jgi:arsenite-transporting ATPase
MDARHMTDLLESRKFIFLGGKGGVGKTTMAAATAVWLADQGYKTLVVATDPTVSLSVVFRQRIDEIEPTRIDGFSNLDGLNIDPKKAPGLFQKRLEGMTQSFTDTVGKDVLNTPCAEEMAAFDQFASYLNNDDYDRIVFDTAPTGHTLRELSMPFDWSGYMENLITTKKELSSALGWSGDEETIVALRKEKERYDQAIKALSDHDISAFNLVLLPEKLSVEETARAIRDLGCFGIRVPALIVNEVIPPEVLKGNWFLERRRGTQERYLQEIASRFYGRIIAEMPLLESDIHGVESLRRVGSHLFEVSA